VETQAVDGRYDGANNAGARFSMADPRTPFPIVQIVHILVAVQQEMH
jgi:hypothetical protein